MLFTTLDANVLVVFAAVKVKPQEASRGGDLHNSDTDYAVFGRSDLAALLRLPHRKCLAFFVVTYPFFLPSSTGGVIAMSDFQQRFFPDSISHAGGGSGYCTYNDHILQLFTSCLFLAAAFTALIGMWTCRKWGRRVTMIMGGAAFIIGTVLVTSAFHVAQLVIGRLVLGVGVGFATQVRG